MKKVTIFQIASLIGGIASLVLLWSVDWRIAVGIFVWTWSQNVDNRVKVIKLSELL